MRRVSALVFVVFLSHISLAETVPFRLSDAAIPQHYSIDLTIVPDADRFFGRVDIDVELREASDALYLHGRNLDVEAVAVITEDGRRIVGDYEQLDDDGMARVDVPETLEPQRIRLTIDYSAPFSSSLNAMYKVIVGDDHYAFTQFESVYARSAFPSFDEPRFKTTFDIAVTTRERYRALSTSSAERTETLGGGLKRIRYARTLPLPTYLIAFAVGPLDVVEWEAVPPSAYRDTPLALRGVTTRGNGARIEYALENTAAILNELENYFASPYPFDKLDIVAVPDFAWGAMENVGLITYREPLVLLGDTPGVNQVRFYALVHAHELAHQWFGNLVTMPWWDDIWLNEAFASWIQARIGHEWDPSFNFDRSTQAGAIRAMQEDSLTTARVIRQPVSTTADIVNAFDSITYRKGGGVLGMLEHYLGEDTFRDALRRHMRNFEFGSADVYDLIDSLTAEAGADKQVREIFESFLFQRGVPDVSAARDCSDPNAPAVEISQQRFLPVGSSGQADSTWAIPVCLAHGQNGQRTEQCVVLDRDTARVPLAADACPDWVMPNANGAGYYRWRVPPTEFAALRDVFMTELTARERISYADSLVAGVESGSIGMAAFFEALPAVLAARERAVVETPLPMMKRIVDALEGDDRARARRHMATLLQRRLDAIDGGNFESETEAQILRARLIRVLAVDLRDREQRARLVDGLHRQLGYRNVEPDSRALSPDLLRAAAIVAVQEGGSEFLEFLLARFTSEASSRFRMATLEALAHNNDLKLTKTAHDFVGTSSARGNELDRWLDYALAPDGAALNWEWLEQNLGYMLRAGGTRTAREAPYALGRWLCSERDARRLRQLFTDRNDTPQGTQRNLDRAMERIDLCIAFGRRHAKDAAVALR